MRSSIVATLAVLFVAVTPAAVLAAPATAPRLAPDFTLKDLNGKPHRLSDYRGNVVLLNFWATWCPPCRHEMPSMQRAYEALQDRGFVIVGVEVGEGWETVAPFVDQMHVTYPILLDESSSISRQWRVVGLPMTYVIDPRGRVVDAIVGGRDWSDPALRARLIKLLPAAR